MVWWSKDEPFLVAKFDRGYQKCRRSRRPKGGLVIKLG
jgi:hypothetical protein